MTGKIFKSTLAVAIVVLMLSFAVITGVLYQYFENIQQRQLKDELKLAAAGTEQLGEKYLDGLSPQAYRLTWINAEGEVIYDSHANLQNMDNHGDREEIKEAFLYGKGSSNRKSATMTEKTSYEAERLEDGSVLRISSGSATALLLVLGMLQPICCIMAVAVIISALLAHKMAKKFVEPLNHLDLDSPLENDVYEELSPLLRRINAQQNEIRAQMETLREKEEEFNHITGNMKEALVLLSNTNRIVSINPAAKRLFGAETDCIGEDFLKTDRTQSIRTALEKARTDGQYTLQENRNGREYRIDFNSIDSSGSLQGIVILGFDITEKINAERNRQEFTANVSHELKTPLQSIIGSVELMENGIVKSEDMPRFIGYIRKEAIRLFDLIEDIIRLSQLDSGAEMDWENVPLLMQTEEICETLESSAKEKGVSFEIIGKECIVYGVGRLIYEVIYNLCDNGIKYNKTGGTVKIAVEEKSDGTYLTVEDTGVGIPIEHQEKIFERFYRVDKSHSKKSGGTGLGLSIVKHAVLYHHGNITLESKVGIGTKFKVFFPFRQNKTEDLIQPRY